MTTTTALPPDECRWCAHLHTPGPAGVLWRIRGEAWGWEVSSSAYTPEQRRLWSPTEGGWAQGDEPTFEEADRALCGALRELGWLVLGAP